MAFHFIFLFPFIFSYIRAFLVVSSVICLYLSFTHFLLDCLFFFYCFLKGFLVCLFLNIFKRVTNVSEVCLLVKFVFICFLKFPNFLNNDHYGPKLLWILHYSVLLVNFPMYFLKICIYILLLLKLWGKVMYCKYILPKTI